MKTMVMDAKKMKHPRILEEEEIAHMLNAAKKAGSRNYMLLKCLYCLGLKAGEARRLMVKDIDFEQNVVNIGGRRIMIPGAFTFELKQFVKGREGLVFTGRGTDGGLSGRHIRRLVKEAARKGNVRNCGEIKPHTLRVSYATHLRRDGIPVKAIQSLLGHARRETTYMYTHGLKQINGAESEDEKPNEEGV